MSKSNDEAAKDSRTGSSTIECAPNLTTRQDGRPNPHSQPSPTLGSWRRGARASCFPAGNRD